MRNSEFQNWYGGMFAVFSVFNSLTSNRGGHCDWDWLCCCGCCNETCWVVTLECSAVLVGSDSDIKRSETRLPGNGKFVIRFRLANFDLYIRTFGRLLRGNWSLGHLIVSYVFLVLYEDAIGRIHIGFHRANSCNVENKDVILYIYGIENQFLNFKCRIVGNSYFTRFICLTYL